MARPIDPRLRENLLDDVIEAVARLGLGSLSLREVARELRVSPRMLLYHFGSRDGMLDAVVAETARRLADAADLAGDPADVARAAWTWIAAPERRPFATVFYEVCMLGAREPARRGVVASSLFGDWHALLVRRGVADAQATLVLATLHGLLLDLVLTDDRARVDRAMDAYVATLASQEAVVA